MTHCAAYAMTSKPPHAAGLALARAACDSARCVVGATGRPPRSLNRAVRPLTRQHEPCGSRRKASKHAGLEKSAFFPIARFRPAEPCPAPAEGRGRISAGILLNFRPACVLALYGRKTRAA